jgi:hypothetical protein
MKFHLVVWLDIKSDIQTVYGFYFNDQWSDHEHSHELERTTSRSLILLASFTSLIHSSFFYERSRRDKTFIAPLHHGLNRPNSAAKLEARRRRPGHLVSIFSLDGED